MEWYVEAQFVATLDDEQLAEVAEGTTITRYNSETRVLTVQGRVQGDDYQTAMAEAQKWIGALPGVRALAGVVGAPQRVVVESAEAHAQGAELLGAAEVAERLGVSTARVRQLEERPDWPAPVAELAGGRIYRASDIDEFRRRPRRPGRPSKAARE